MVQSNPAAHPEPLKQRSLWHPLYRRPGGRVGRVIPIEGFNEYGFVELEMTPPRFRGWDSIWIEPTLLKKVGWSLVRRYKLSKIKGPKRSKVARTAELRRNARRTS